MQLQFRFSIFVLFEIAPDIIKIKKKVKTQDLSTPKTFYGISVWMVMKFE